MTDETHNTTTTATTETTANAAVVIPHENDPDYHTHIEDGIWVFVTKPEVKE